MRVRSLWYTFALASVVSLTVGVATAQNPESKAPEYKGNATEPSSKPSAVKEPAVVEPAVQEPTPMPADAGPPLYGRVTAKEAAVRCFASQRSPAYEDILREGDVVMVGEATGEFRKVILPLGVMGYVHRDFATAPVDGEITTTRQRVSFRYRPKAGEAPPELLEQGTRLRLLAVEGSWLKVRMVPVAAWLPIKDIQVFQEATPTLVKSCDALRKLHAEECAKAAEAFAKADAEAKLRQEQLAKVEQVREQLMATRELPEDQELAQLVKLAATMEELQKEFQEESPAALGARLLAADIKGRHIAVEAAQVLREQPKPSNLSAARPAPVENPLARFAATGWLRLDEGSTGHLRFRLEKGTKLIAYVTCDSRRYALELFDGVEVGVRGKRSLAGLPVAPLIDVMRVEILSVARD